LLSGSKFIWGATLVILFLFALRDIHFSFLIKAKKLILCLICLVIFSIISPYLYQKSLQDFSPEYYRGYALVKSLEIWKDHPLMGSGPGTYGGVVSLIYNSSIYDQYNFESRWFNFMQGPRSLDQFWPQCLAEMGIVGFISFAVLILLLFYLPRMILNTILEPDLKLFLMGLYSLVIVLVIYLCVSGLNMTSFILTYSILLGMCLSVINPLNHLNRSMTNECSFSR
jgi:O-antigen ligase